MSKYVSEIIKDMKTNPNTYTSTRGDGVRKSNVAILGFGNTRVFSTISLRIKGESMPISYFDSWNLEVAVGKWYKKAPLSVITAE